VPSSPNNLTVATKNAGSTYSTANGTAYTGAIYKDASGNLIDVSGNPLTETKAETTTTTTPTTEGATGNTPANIQAEIDAIKTQSEADIAESKILQDSLVNAETEYKDTITDLANTKYETEQANLDRMEALQAETLKLKNEAISASAEQKRQDAQLAYEKNARDLEEQKKKTEQAYKEQIVEQAVSNTKRTLEMESYIGATGGFGSLIKNKQLQEVTLSNDRLLNSVKFEADSADREIANDIIEVTDQYKNDLFDIETEKQTAINDAYNTYLEYVTDIQNDRELTEDERYDAIQTAQANYKTNVASINQTAFENRYTISQTASLAVRDLKFRQVDTNISAIYGYAVDKNGNAILDEYGNKIEVPPEAVSTKEYIEPQYDAYGRMTSPGGSFDTVTGEFVADSALGVPSYIRQSGGVNYSSPEVKSYLEDIFGVGDVGGWCGDYASTISTASKVGNTWTEKYDAITTNGLEGEPTVGDKIVLPLGVTDSDSSYGHVATVIGYNASTGDIYVVESNADGRQSRGEGEGVKTLGTYNLNTLREKYGSNFGFVDGELKEPYKSSVEGIEMSFGSSMYGSESVDAVRLEMEADQLGLTGAGKAKYIQARMQGLSPDDAITQATTSSSSTKLTAGQQEDVITTSGLIDMIDQVNAMYADANLEGVGGLWQGSLGSAWDKVFGSSSDEARNARQLIGNIKGTIAKLRGGTSFTTNEQALLETYVPTINENPEVVISKINNLRSFLQGKLDTMGEIVTGGYDFGATEAGNVETTSVIPADIQADINAGFYTEQEARDAGLIQ